MIRKINTTITNRRQPHGTARKSRPTTTRHQEDKPSKNQITNNNRTALRKIVNIPMPPFMVVYEMLRY